MRWGKEGEGRISVIIISFCFFVAEIKWTYEAKNPHLAREMSDTALRPGQRLPSGGQGHPPTLRMRSQPTIWKACGLTAALRPQSDDSTWMESRSRAFDELETALRATLTPKHRLEAMKFVGIINMIGCKLSAVGPAGEARK